MQNDKNHEQILKYLKRIDNKLSALLHKSEEKEETWVKSTVITKLTGWSKNQMNAARKHKYIIHKKNDGGYWYLLESLKEIHYKK